jgi:hypothetical protein
VLAALLLAGCSCGGSEAHPEPADAGPADVDDAESGPDGTEGGKDAESEDAADAWDPVWHETEAKDWPTAPQATEPSCGQGCRVALDVAPYAPSYIHFQDSEFGLAAVNVSQRNVFYAPFGSDETFIVAQGDLAEMSNGFSQPYLRGELLSVTYMRPGNPGGEVRVINLRTGETKIPYEYTRSAGDLGITFTLINDKYVFWDRDGHGIMSLNLETGQVRTLVHFLCLDLCAVPTGLVCMNSPNLFIDQETGEMTTIAPGAGLQVDATCSHERDEITWVDYRDPPGTDPSEGGRNGGEVYMKDLVSGELTRLTHDSPDSPEAKAYPAVGKELAVWKAVAEGFERNPSWAQEVYGVTQDLMVLDRKTGQRCRIHSDIVKYFTHMVVRGRTVYGNIGHVVGIDVDDPAIGCVPE